MFGHYVRALAFKHLTCPVLIWDLPHIVWKRRKDLLYLGSCHGCELPEFYGFTGDHVGTDALSMYTLLASPLPGPGC